MKENDIKRFAAIVREYHRQKRTQAGCSLETYRDACDTLQDEIV